MRFTSVIASLFIGVLTYSSLGYSGKYQYGREDLKTTSPKAGHLKISAPGGRLHLVDMKMESTLSSTNIYRPGCGDWNALHLPFTGFFSGWERLPMSRSYYPYPKLDSQSQNLILDYSSRVTLRGNCDYRLSELKLKFLAEAPNGLAAEMQFRFVNYPSVEGDISGVRRFCDLTTPTELTCHISESNWRRPYPLVLFFTKNLDNLIERGFEIKVFVTE